MKLRAHHQKWVTDEREALRVTRRAGKEDWVEVAVRVKGVKGKPNLTVPKTKKPKVMELTYAVTVLHKPRVVRRLATEALQAEWTWIIQPINHSSTNQNLNQVRQTASSTCLQAPERKSEQADFWIKISKKESQTVSWCTATFTWAGNFHLCSRRLKCAPTNGKKQDCQSTRDAGLLCEHEPYKDRWSTYLIKPRTACDL